MSNGSPKTPGPMRLAGMGMELAGAVIGFVLLGWWIDGTYETRPWGLLVCGLLGIVGGLYNLIRQSLHEAIGLKNRPSPKGSPDGMSSDEKTEDLSADRRVEDDHEMESDRAKDTDL